MSREIKAENTLKSYFIQLNTPAINTNKSYNVTRRKQIEEYEEALNIFKYNTVVLINA